MTSIDTYAGALEGYRFTPRQARFVATVALHGGYFLRRHYMAFAGIGYGAVVRRFPDQLVARGLAVRERGRGDRGYLYHLSARGLYRALRQEDNRNRRPASFAAIGRKLMLLDFVLAHPDIDWVATEVDKVALATMRLGVPLADLPQHTYGPEAAPSSSTRYFPHKLPLGLAGDPVTLHLVALALDSRGDGVRRWLIDHRRLLGAAPMWVVSLVALAGSTVALGTARQALEPLLAPPPVVTDPDHARFLALQRALDRNDLATVSVADLHWYRQVRSRYGAPDGRASANAGSAAPRDRDPTDADRAALRRGQVRTHELPFAYEQCGDLAGVC